MADNRFNPIDNYEQLKRKNRRRLLGAVILVILAGALLIKVLNQDHSQQKTTKNNY